MKTWIRFLDLLEAIGGLFFDGDKDGCRIAAHEEREI